MTAAAVALLRIPSGRTVKFPLPNPPAGACLVATVPMCFIFPDSSSPKGIFSERTDSPVQFGSRMCYKPMW
jgi:hypothetical protein